MQLNCFKIIKNITNTYQPEDLFFLNKPNLIRVYA